MTYSEYLKSPHWKNLKRRYARSKLPKFCLACKKPEYILHHITYENLGAETFADFVTLCHDCHNVYHTKYGTKNLKENTARFIWDRQKELRKKPKKKKKVSVVNQKVLNRAIQAYKKNQKAVLVATGFYR